MQQKLAAFICMQFTRRYRKMKLAKTNLLLFYQLISISQARNTFFYNLLLFSEKLFLSIIKILKTQLIRVIFDANI